MKRIKENMIKVAKFVSEVLDCDLGYSSIKESDHLYFKLCQ